MGYLVIDTSSVSWERLAGEVIAIQLATGHYYSMGGVAADLWSLLEAGEDLAGILGKLSHHYEIPSEGPTQVSHFLDNAKAVGLLKEATVASNRSIELPNDHQRSEWVPPILQEYTDLQDLILVDPVHDTKPTGWPELKDE